MAGAVTTRQNAQQQTRTASVPVRSQTKTAVQRMHQGFGNRAMLGAAPQLNETINPEWESAPNSVRASHLQAAAGTPVQRKCDCGGSAGFSGECEACKSSKLLGKPLQRKLAINEPGDEYEQEADRAADQVMRMSDVQVDRDVPRTSSVPLVQRRVNGSGPAGIGTAPPIVPDVVSKPGQPLDAATRAFFEPRVGHDFGEVRVHTDARAAESARAVHANAYTIGKDLVFGASQYRPVTTKGRLLLAHELAHVVQQDGGMGQGCRLQRQEEVDGAEGSAQTGGLGPVIDVGDGVQVQLLTTAAVPQLPDWIPTDLRQQIRDGELPTGVTRWQSPGPWGDLVIWVAGPGAFQRVEVYQEYPEDVAFYMELMEGNTYAAHVLTDAFTQYNLGMTYLVDGQGYRPSDAQNELRRSNEEVLVLVVQTVVEVYSGGFGLAAFQSLPPANFKKIINAAERTGFTNGLGPPRGLDVEASTGVVLPAPEPMTERLRAGIISQAPPTRVVGDVINGEQIVRKTVAVDTPLGRTTFGKMWGAESIRAQEAALKKLEAAGFDTAKVRQSFSDTGELILDYVGRSVDEEWPAMGREGQDAYNSFVWHAKQEMGVVHDLKKANIAYQRFEIDGQVLHRFVVFDPAFDRYSVLVATVGGVALAIIGSVAFYQIMQTIENK